MGLLIMEQSLQTIFVNESWGFFNKNAIAKPMSY